jgi:hypothetical protein
MRKKEEQKSTFHNKGKSFTEKEKKENNNNH